MCLYFCPMPITYYIFLSLPLPPPPLSPSPSLFLTLPLPLSLSPPLSQDWVYFCHHSCLGSIPPVRSSSSLVNFIYKYTVHIQYKHFQIWGTKKLLEGQSTVVFCCDMCLAYIWWFKEVEWKYFCSFAFLYFTL